MRSGTWVTLVWLIWSTFRLLLLAVNPWILTPPSRSNIFLYIEFLYIEHVWDSPYLHGDSQSEVGHRIPIRERICLGCVNIICSVNDVHKIANKLYILVIEPKWTHTISSCRYFITLWQTFWMFFSLPFSHSKPIWLLSFQRARWHPRLPEVKVNYLSFQTKVKVYGVQKNLNNLIASRHCHFFFKKVSSVLILFHNQ